jgi:hypothetical protein
MLEEAKAKAEKNGGVATKTTPTKTTPTKTTPTKTTPTKTTTTKTTTTTNKLTPEAQREQLDKRYDELIKEQELLPATSEGRKQINKEINALDKQYNAIPSGKKGLKLPDWMPGIGKNQDIPSFLHLGEEVIEAEEIKALARITELAKTLIEQFGKDAKYQFGGQTFANRVAGHTKGFGGNEGAGYSVVGAKNAVKLMAELGITNLNQVNRMSTDMYGNAAHNPFKARGGWGGTVEGSMFQSGEDAMKELTGMIKGIETAKMKLIDMDQSGVSIPFEVAMKNIKGAQLNDAAMNRVDIGGSDRGGFTNVDASTPVINNTTNVVQHTSDTDGGRGRGLGISG